ncbi:hypothetical protein [Sciscionella sediminilitoris]|uniref:hypothetical protein n=1 Tax=Sciscionella sediminilitoris TaxID=1445613 RepID=UPI0006EB507E|nr:hypothetical protein [Sciscionella sp. SE31]
MQHRTKLVGGIAAAVLAISGVGAGVAAAETQPAPQPSADQQQAQNQDQKPQPGKKKHRSPLAKVSHGELTMEGKKHRVVDIQRGAVTAVNTSSITVRSSDGFTKSYAVNDKTKVRAVPGKKPEKITDVHTGDEVGIRADKAGNTSTATLIADRGAGK